MNTKQTSNKPLYKLLLMIGVSVLVMVGCGQTGNSPQMTEDTKTPPTEEEIAQVQQQIYEVQVDEYNRKLGLAEIDYRAREQRLIDAINEAELDREEPLNTIPVYDQLIEFQTSTYYQLVNKLNQL